MPWTISEDLHAATGIMRLCVYMFMIYVAMYLSPENRKHTCFVYQFSVLQRGDAIFEQKFTR